MSELKTLGYYKKICETEFPKRGLAFINQKITESPNGENEKVIAAESQMLYLLNEIEHEEK